MPAGMNQGPDVLGGIRWMLCLLGLLGSATAWSQPPAEQSIRVAICELPGRMNQVRVERVRRCLPDAGGFRCSRMTPAEIRAGRLRGFDVLVMPGGSSRKEGATLGELGRRNIRAFVRDGGGYVGICAGAYLATPGDHNLGLINARLVDREHWARGNGDVWVKLTPLGRRALHDDHEKVRIHYAQGPLLAHGDWSDLPRYEALATFATGIAKHGAPRGVMVGTTAIARANYGDGRVMCFSPHPEFPGGPHRLLAVGVRWAAGQDGQSLTSPITPEGRRLARFLDDLDVEHRWLARESVHWKTGKYDPRGYQHATHCSAFLAGACYQADVYILRPPEHSQVLLANAQQKWLLRRGPEHGWHRVRSWEDAQRLANEGYLVVASYSNPNRRRPGHVALVRPSTRSLREIEEDGPEVIWTGTHNHNSGSLRQGFGHHPIDQVLFFAHRPGRYRLAGRRALSWLTSQSAPAVSSLLAG
jgi:Biotin-protein ligase, N terminal